MRIKVFATYQEATDRRMRDWTMVVVDLLRASTTIVQALESGAHSVIPVESMDEAAMIKRNRGADTLLAGERNGLRIEGCDLGNSPLEFTPQTVRRKVIAMSTSNGSRAIQRVKLNDLVVVGALRNRGRLCRFLAERGGNIGIVCAGTDGEFSADDIYCVGGILEGLQGLVGPGDIQMSDLGFVALEFYHRAKENPALLRNIEHYKKLEKLGFQEDLDHCFQEDKSEVLPVLADGISLLDITKVPTKIG